MKKYNKIYITALSTVLLLSACNKQLDLKPYQSLDQDVAIQTAQDVQVTLVGAYNRAALGALYGGGVYFYADLMASQTLFNWTGTFQTQTDMVDQAITIDNSSVDATWFDGYQVINATNNVLANISKALPANRDRTQGEAEFLRGMTYFDLARLFGRDWNDGDPAVNLAVPIVLTPTKSITPDSYVKRATVAAVYAQAISDLKDAAAKLPANNSFYANKYAAMAILARLYLQKGDYTNALASASAVINSGAFSLNGSYAEEFPYPGQNHADNTDEDIFMMQVTPQQGVNTLNTFYASADNAGRGEIEIKQSFLDSFEQDDDRLYMYQYDSDGVLRVDKFDNVDGNVHIIRLAELYLIRAEASLRLGQSGGPLSMAHDDIKLIRDRAVLPEKTTVTIDDVMNERVHELAFEGGFFLYDAKRTNTDSGNPVLVGALNAFSPKLVFPIPQVELNANHNLVQNPGYGVK